MLTSLIDKSRADAVGWWETLIAPGGEGMVVKPRDFVSRLVHFVEVAHLMRLAAQSNRVKRVLVLPGQLLEQVLPGQRAIGSGKSVKKLDGRSQFARSPGNSPSPLAFAKGKELRRGCVPPRPIFGNVPRGAQRASYGSPRGNAEIE